MTSKVVDGREASDNEVEDECESGSEVDWMKGLEEAASLQEAAALLDATLDLLKSFPDGTILGGDEADEDEDEGENDGGEAAPDDEVVFLDAVEDEPEVADESQVEQAAEIYPQMLRHLLEFLPTLPVSSYRQDGGDWNYKRITRDWDYVVSALHDEASQEERFIPPRLDGWEKFLEDHIRRRPKVLKLDTAPSASSQRGEGIGARVCEGVDLKRFDNEGRPYDFSTIVVNFANVGTTFGKKFDNGAFHWEGVRRCLKGLKEEWNFKSCVGIVVENWHGLDGYPNSAPVFGIPDDIRAMCDTIEETPRISDAFHKSADDEMTIKCAYRRNCLFLDNDNYRDWQAGLLGFAKAREWLVTCKEIVHLRYYFDQGVGTFELLQGLVTRNSSCTTGEKVATIRRAAQQAHAGRAPAKTTTGRSSLPAPPPAPPAPPAAPVDSEEQHRVQKALLQQCLAPRRALHSSKPSQSHATHSTTRSSKGLSVDLTEIDGAEVGEGGAVSSTANVNTHIQGWTPLCAAVSEGTEHVVASLLNQKADPNIPTSFGVAPIFYAVRNWRPRIIRWLLRAGAKVSQARGPDGESLEQALREKLGTGPAASKAVFDNWTLLRSLRLHVEDLLLPKDREALRRWKASQPVDLTKSSSHRHHHHHQAGHHARRPRPEGGKPPPRSHASVVSEAEPELVDLTQPSVKRRRLPQQQQPQVEEADVASGADGAPWQGAEATNLDDSNLLPIPELSPAQEAPAEVEGSDPAHFFDYGCGEDEEENEENEEDNAQSWAKLQSALQEAASNFQASKEGTAEAEPDAEVDPTADSAMALDAEVDDGEYAGTDPYM